MKNKLGVFFKMVKYETLRVFRNKLVVAMLLGFSSIIIFFAAAVNSNLKSVKIGINPNGLALEQITILDSVKSKLSLDDFVMIKTFDQGKEMVKNNQIDLFINIDPTTNPISAVILYDDSNTVGRSIKNSLKNNQNVYLYNSVKEALAEYGITIDESYFDSIKFESVTGKLLTVNQRPFAIEAACCLSVILTFGLAYSISRDNETNISKNIKYIPVGANRYLLSKILPYLMLGVVESALIFLFGAICFKIHYQLNIMILLVMTLLFVLATIMSGLLFSMCKSQIASVFLDMIFILLPIFVLTTTSLNCVSPILKCILYFMPITGFLPFINGMMFNGVVIWWPIVLFVLQIIGYYLLSLLLLKRRSVK